MLTNKIKLKKITTICLLIVLLMGSILSFTFAYFSDNHEKGITINVADISAEFTNVEELSAENLIAGTTFKKNLTVNLTTDFKVFIRTYAVVEMECYNETGTEIITRTDLVDLTGVSKSFKGKDNKYYYAPSQNNKLVASISSQSLTLTFTFKTSDLISEDLFTDSNFILNKNLKTTITYYVEYCQEIGYSDWTMLGENTINLDDGLTDAFVNNGDGTYTISKLENGSRFSNMVSINLDPGDYVLNTKINEMSTTGNYCFFILIYYVDGASKDIPLAKSSLNAQTNYITFTINLPKEVVAYRFCMWSGAVSGDYVTFSDFSFTKQ